MLTDDVCIAGAIHCDVVQVLGTCKAAQVSGVSQDRIDDKLASPIAHNFYTVPVSLRATIGF